MSTPSMRCSYHFWRTVKLVTCRKESQIRYPFYGSIRHSCLPFLLSKSLNAVIKRYIVGLPDCSDYNNYKKFISGTYICILLERRPHDGNWRFSFELVSESDPRQMKLRFQRPRLREALRNATKRFAEPSYWPPCHIFGQGMDVLVRFT